MALLPDCQQQDTSSACSLSLLKISGLEMERRKIPGISFPNLTFHLQPLEQAPLEQEEQQLGKTEEMCENTGIQVKGI